MNEEYMSDELVLKEFAESLDDDTVEDIIETFLEEASLIYYDDGNLDVAAMLCADYFQRLSYNEFVEVEQYLTELCVHIDDDDLRDYLIEEFDLDRDYIESEIY